jgi:propane monooxygenase small subunit
VPGAALLARRVRLAAADHRRGDEVAVDRGDLHDEVAAEQLTATRDWAEQFFATALVFEPLVGELFRSHFVMQVAAIHGDFVTPTVIGGGEADAAREQRGARHLFELLVADEEHGDDNAALLASWAAKWAPLCENAARQLQPIWSQVPEKTLRFQDSFERAQARFESQLADLGIATPEGA